MLRTDPLSVFCAAPRLTTASARGRLRYKEREHKEKEMAKARNIGDGVSTYAQQVFNGLSKTYAPPACQRLHRPPIPPQFPHARAPAVLFTCVCL